MADASAATTSAARIVFIGAGPGEADLITVRGARLLAQAKVVLFDALADPSLRAEAEVVLLAPDGAERVRFVLSRCLPIKVKAPPLNAKDGAIAVEELQLAYERISVKRAGGL